MMEDCVARAVDLTHESHGTSKGEGVMSMNTKPFTVETTRAGNCDTARAAGFLVLDWKMP